ncbi:MAG: class I tRNA ligase family protein, partial [Candidatus Acidiferrum sp.]
EGSWRFLNRVFRLIDKHAAAIRESKNWNFDSKGMSDKERDLIRVTYQTMLRVTQDFEKRWHFNSAIAQIMELTNEIYLAEPLENGVRPEIQKEVLQILTLLLAPMTPHIAEEMWEMLGNKDGLWNATWPVLADAQLDLAKDNEVEIPVQINGRVRTTLKVPAGASESDVVAKAKADPAVARHIEGKRIVKVIFVLNKLLNLVVK